MPYKRGRFFSFSSRRSPRGLQRESVAKRRKVAADNEANAVATGPGLEEGASGSAPAIMGAAAVASRGLEEDLMAAARARCEAAKAQVQELAERAAMLERSNAALFNALPPAHQKKHVESTEGWLQAQFTGATPRDILQHMTPRQTGAADEAAGVPTLLTASPCAELRKGPAVNFAQARHGACVAAVQGLAGRVKHLEAEEASLLRAQRTAQESKGNAAMAFFSWFCLSRAN